MKLVCPQCGSPQSRPVGDGSKRECSACYYVYELPKAKRSKAEKKETATEPEQEE
jgi:hypothetical protein